MSSVEFRNVGVGYGEVTAVRDISFTVASGELVTLLGPSGCGKTTTLNLVAGFLRPAHGAILIDGRAVENLPAHRRNTAMVFQGYALFPHLTVARNVAFGLEMRKLPRDEIARRVDEALDLVQLLSMRERYPRQLSGGQQQRVALARALAVNPALLLMDEPLSNLDARLREEVRTNIKKLATRLGITALYVTHDQVEAMVLADRIAVMAHGEILQIGNPYDLYRAPANAQIAEFFGSINWLHGKMRADGRVDTELGALVIAAPRQYEGDVVLGIRPEDVKFVEPSTELENRLAGSVATAFFLGDHCMSEVKIGATVINVKSLPDDAKAAGSVTVHLPPQRMVVFPAAQAQKSLQPK